jgi:pseudouridine synthase
VLDDGPAAPKDVRVLRADGSTTWVQLTFAEGRKREVRRYAQALGHPVRRLIRVQFGPLRLGSLRAGTSRPLTEVELAALNRLRGGNPSPILRGLDR